MTGDGGDADPPLSTSERAELLRLRARLAGRSRAGARSARWVAATVLLVVAGLLFSVSVVAVFVRTQLLDTDRYVATISPLARDPAVQDAVTARVTTELMNVLDIAGLTHQLTDALQQRGAPAFVGDLAGPLTGGVQSFLSTQVHAVVASDMFARLWDSGNRAAHDELDAVLTTGTGRLLTANGTEVSLNVGSLVAAVRQRLVAQGFSLAAKIPDIDLTVPLFHADALPRIRTAVSVLNTLAWVLPVMALLGLLAGILIAPDRRRGLLLAAAVTGILLALLLGGLAGVRTYYLNHLPPSIASPAAVAVLYDTMTRFLVAALQTLLGLAVIVLILAWVAGPARPAVALRSVVGAGLSGIGRGLDRTGVPLGPVPGFLRRQRRAIVAAAVVLALAVLVRWRTPGLAGLIWTTVAVLGLLGVVETVARSSTVDDKTPAADPARSG